MNALAYDWMEKQDYVQARENFEQMVDDLDSGEASSMSHSDLERELEKRSRELMRQLLQEHLDKRGPGQCQEPVCGADRQERPRKRTHARDLETIFGKVQVERTGYGCPGTDSLHPLDAELKQIVDANNATLAQVPRPRPEGKRVWASLEKEPAQVIEQVFDEARKRDPSLEKTWVALVDGEKSQIRRLRRTAQKAGIDLTIACDVVHVIEYLWAAGRAFYPESGPELEGWVRHRLLGILDGKAGLIGGGMRRSATRRGLSCKAREPVDKCATYLLNHAPYLDYDRYLAAGMPIATGVIEGACRHLVKDRMEITGARWGLTGAEAVLRLRALRSSGDFDAYWNFHEACEYRRNHQSRYAGGLVPETNSSRSSRKSPNLKRVK